MPPHMSVVRILLAQKATGAVAAGDAEAALALRMRGVEVRLSRNERRMDIVRNAQARGVIFSQILPGRQERRGLRFEGRHELAQLADLVIGLA